MARQIAILAVIVLYKRSLDQSSAVSSLLASFERLNEASDLRLKILAYGNGSIGKYSAKLPDNIEYHSSAVNGGLAPAYNYALKRAVAEGFDWLLTLDQDSTLPGLFLSKLTSIVKQIVDREEIAGIVPDVVSGDRFISPHLLKRGRSVRLPAEFVGVAEGEVSAINSGVTWRTRLIEEIGGFNSLFWLDYLDHWLFREVQCLGKRIYVAGNIELEHELSLLNKNKQLSAQRLENILGAESAFCDLYFDWRYGLAKTATLTVRLSKLFIRGDTRLMRVMWQCLKARLFLSRTARVERWKKAMSDRIGQAPAGIEE